jgi:CRISPR-associated protein Csb2
MTSLVIGFPGRRYHATPWGHHVNEGQVEWPPAPWRILRALLSVGFTACDWTAVPDEARALIEILAPVLPRYRLPPVVGAHSRHYMPTDGKPTLVFDTWAQIDDGELIITWPAVALLLLQRELLEKLATRLNYLGRSESWVSVRVLDEDPHDHNCLPEVPGYSSPGPGWEQVPLLAPVAAADYVAWRSPLVDQVLADMPLPEVKKKPTAKGLKLQQARDDAAAVYPTDLLACLLTTTAFLRGHGWSQPPGSRRVFYWRRTDAMESGAPCLSPARLTVAPVEAMLLSLTTASGNDHALPPLSRALPQGELLHQALVALGGKDSPAIRGTDDERRPLSGHQHVHLLHLDLDDDGHLDHCLVWAPAGLDAAAQAVIRAVRRTFTKGGSFPVRLAVAASWRHDQLRQFGNEQGNGLRRVLGSVSGSRVWTSITPFVPPRFVKRNGKNTIMGQISAELKVRNIPEARVEVLDQREQNFLHLRHAIRVRRRGAAPPPVNCGFALRLTFPEPIFGPLCLGYASHFGLGLFAALHESP